MRSNASVPEPTRDEIDRFRLMLLASLLERTTTETFRQYVDRVTRGRFKWYAHCTQLADILQRVADGELDRVMVFMPPRHGKSELVSRLFPGYYLRKWPERWVGLASYSANLAVSMSKAARAHFQDHGGALDPDSSAADHWQTTEGGGMWATGVGGPATGKGFHLGIIDDPLKNAQEAESEATRRTHNDWHDSTWTTRREPGAAEIHVATRWHDLDLAGYRLGLEAEEPEGWHIVSMEAIKDSSTPEIPTSCTLEPDPRAPGEPLCPERYPLRKLEGIAKRIGTYFWNALFQQRPRPREGGTFKRDWFAYVDAVPDGAVRAVRAWDRAATEGGGDWTVGLKAWRLGIDMYVEDVERFRHSSGQRDRLIRAVAERDGPRVEIEGEQEPGAAGKTDAAAFRQLLAGFRVRVEPATGSKEIRAGPVASAAEAGNVYLVRGAWNRPFLDVVCAFPTGAHDDDVDVLAMAYNRLFGLTVDARADPGMWFPGGNGEG